MRLSALLIAATASAALASAATAQTNTTTTSTTTTQSAPAGQAAAPPPASLGAPPVQAPGVATPATVPAPVAGPFRPITPAPGADVVAVLQASGQFTTLLKIADATNLTATLKSPNLTVLAPTDAAFAALPPSALDLKDPANLQKLQALLAYHVINAKVPPLKGHSATPVQTVAQKPVTLDGSGDLVKINDATALQAQVAVAGNSVIYPIDKVLSPDYVPPPAAAALAATEDAATTTKSTTTTTKKTSKKKR